MKRIINYFSYKQIKKDIYKDTESQGRTKGFNLKLYLLLMLLSFILVFSFCLLFKIGLFFNCLVAVFFLTQVPIIIRRKYLAASNENKFKDVDIYLHQMLYSFRRSSKIDRALKDSYKISEGKLKTCIKKALDELSFGVGENVYKDAFDIIEAEYGCDRMRALHKFLMAVEKKGGNTRNSLEVLNYDFDNWVSSVYKFQKEIKKIRRDTTIGLFISIGLALITSYLCLSLNRFSQNPIDITKDLSYNISTSVFLILSIAFLSWNLSSYKGDYLKSLRSDKKIMDNYNLAFKKSTKSLYLISIPLIVIILLAAIICFILKLEIISIYLLISLAFILIHPVTAKRRAKKIAVNDLREGFTSWLRDLSLGLSKAPLYVALEQSLRNCPIIIKEELEKFLEKIDINPLDVNPYYEFLSEFNCLDVSSAVRTLYSIGEMENESADETINVLVKRNNEISQKFDEERYSDITSGLKFLEYLPTFFAAFKISADMLLIITRYL